MIKKILFTVSLFFISLSAFTQNYLKDENGRSLKDYYYFFPQADIAITPDNVIFNEMKFPRSEFRLDKNGYYYVKDYIVIFDELHKLVALHNTYLNYKQVTKDEPLSYGENAAFKPSTYFSETLKSGKVNYDGSDLDKIWKETVINTEHSSAPWWIKDEDKLYTWNYGHLPWVAGGKGIGENIEVTFENAIFIVSFLNGYVDPFHPDYFKKNARVKDIKVTDLDNDKDYYFTLSDSVKVKSFRLENSTKHIKVTIESVYKGEKYNDVCLSMISGLGMEQEWERVYPLMEPTAEVGYEESYWTQLADNAINRYSEYTDDNSPVFEKNDEGLYELYIDCKNRKEYGDWAEVNTTPVTIFDRNDLKITLVNDDGRYDYITFWSKEAVKAYSFKGINYGNRECIDSMGWSEQDRNKKFEEIKNEGSWIIEKALIHIDWSMILPVSVEIKILYESGKKETVFLNKAQLEVLKRYSELALSYGQYK